MSLESIQSNSAIASPYESSAAAINKSNQASDVEQRASTIVDKAFTEMRSSLNEIKMKELEAGNKSLRQQIEDLGFCQYRECWNNKTPADKDFQIASRNYVAARVGPSGSPYRRVQEVRALETSKAKLKQLEAEQHLLKFQERFNNPMHQETIDPFATPLSRDKEGSMLEEEVGMAALEAANCALKETVVSLSYERWKEHSNYIADRVLSSANTAPGWQVMAQTPEELEEMLKGDESMIRHISERIERIEREDSNWSMWT